MPDDMRISFFGTDHEGCDMLPCVYAAPPRVTATINLNNAQMDDTFDTVFGSPTELSLGAGISYSAVTRSAIPCADGHTSQSGYAPGCQLCPPDSYANRPRTNCIPCPLGTVSDAGSGTQFSFNTTAQKACYPLRNTAQVSQGPFKLGYEWVGYYTSALGPGGVTADGTPRVGQGSIVVKITRTQTSGSVVAIEALVTCHHGEDCPPSSGCRNPGITEYYVNGIVNGNRANLVKNTSGLSWHGITDRNTNLFVPGNLLGTISVSDNNNVFNGSFVNTAGSGSFYLWERCHGSTETGGLQPGNRFVVCTWHTHGTHSTRQGTSTQGTMCVLCVCPR